MGSTVEDPVDGTAEAPGESEVPAEVADAQEALAEAPAEAEVTTEVGEVWALAEAPVKAEVPTEGGTASHRRVAGSLKWFRHDQRLTSSLLHFKKLDRLCV